MFPMAIYLHTGDLTIEEAVQYAKLGRELGYDAFWVAEESGKEAFTVLTVVGSHVPDIRLATGIVNVYSRTPTLLAMEASTVEFAVGPRLTLGLGTGGIGFMERGHGIKIERPIARVRETVHIIRALLTGNRLTYEGEFFKIKEFHLRERPIRSSIPLYIAALNPKMIQLAGEVADGVILNWLTPQHIREVRRHLEEGAKRSGRDPARVQIATLTPVCCDPEAEDARWAVKKMIAFYCASPHYHYIVEQANPGWLELAQRIKAVWDSGNHEQATRMVPEEMVPTFTLTGEPSQTRERLLAYQREGVFPVIYPIPRRDRCFDDMTRAVQLVAAALQS